jgi:hypothetical protein
MMHRFRPRLVPTGHGLSIPLIPGFAHVALDLAGPEGVVSVDRGVLRAMGVSPAVAFDEALDWLRHATSPKELKPVDTVPGMFYAAGRNGQVASRLAVLPEWYGEMPFGGLLAGVPGGQQLLVVPVQSMAALEALRVMASAVATSYAHATTPICDQLFWYDGDGWSVVRVERERDGRIAVSPPAAFMARMRQVATMDFVRMAAEA